jgi:hypothetical protein
LLCAVGSAFFLLRIQPGEVSQGERGPSNSWILQAGLVGGMILFLGPLPVWLTGKQASVGLYSNRFALTAMAGASLLWVAGISWIARGWKQSVLVLALLVGLAGAFQLRTLNDYRWSWTRQQRFHWQLFWRAPSILPHTPLIGDGEILTYNRPIPSVNLLYGKPDETREMAYSYYFAGNNPENLVKGVEFIGQSREFPFRASSRDALLLHFPASNCLWVLHPEDIDHPYLPESLREALPAINLSRILPQAQSSSYPPQDVFGPEPEHTWCYFYQKAELARQYSDWQTILALGQEAIAKGYLPGTSPYEWLPFVEGYMQAGMWQEALRLSQENVRKDFRYLGMYCKAWQRVSGKLGLTDQQVVQTAQYGIELGCSPSKE